VNIYLWVLSQSLIKEKCLLVDTLMMLLAYAAGDARLLFLVTIPVALSMSTFLSVWGPTG
jgi:hypothetical protein